MLCGFEMLEYVCFSRNVSFVIVSIVVADLHCFLKYIKILIMLLLSVTLGLARYVDF